MTSSAEADRREKSRNERALEDELIYLTKHGGFTPARLARKPFVSHLLGDNAGYESKRERLISAIHSLREPEASLLLRIFRLSDDTASLATLEGRRVAHGRTIGRGTATVAGLEPAALASLQYQLLTGWYPKSPLPMRVPPSHNGVVMQPVMIRTILVDGIWQETYENYRLLAAFDEADYLSISSSFPGRVRSTSEFTVQTDRLNDSFTHQFWHDPPMKRGKMYDLGFKVQPELSESVQRRVTEVSRAFHEPTHHASIEVLFRGRTPLRLWRFDKLTYLERPGSPTSETVCDLGADKTARMQAWDLYGGLFFGLAFGWDLA